MTFGTNEQINNESMSIEDYEKNEQEMRQRAFGIYEDKRNDQQSALDIANQSLHNDDIAGLNRAEYESILDSYGSGVAPVTPSNQIPVMQQAQQVQQQPVQQPFVQPVQQTPIQQPSQQQATGQAGQVAQPVTPIQGTDPSASSDFLASLFQDDVTGKQQPTTTQTPTIPVAPVTPVVPFQQAQPTQQFQPVQQAPVNNQQQMPTGNDLQFKRELASIAMHNKVNPNTVIKELESLPVEEMYNFLAMKAYQRKSQQMQQQTHTQQTNSSVKENLAKLLTPSVTKITPVAPRYTDNSYVANHSSDTY